MHHPNINILFLFYTYFKQTMNVQFVSRDQTIFSGATPTASYN